MAKTAFERFDSIVFGRILPPSTKEGLDDITHAATIDIENPDHRQFIYEMMNALDTKNSALLTHISLIVAALTFLYTSRSGGGLFELVVVLEIGAYLLLSIFCLRSIRMTSGLLKGTSLAENTALEE